MSRMLSATLATLAPRIRLQLFKPQLENFAFKLHYRATVVLLLACIILVCAKDYFGDAIRCIMSGGTIPSNVIENYCFFMATFTIVRHYNESMLEAGFLPHPGVGPLSGNDEKLHHTYYQWVPFVLFAQSIAFYMPHYIWKKKEGGRIKALVEGLQNASLSLRNENEDLKVNGKKIDTRDNISNKVNLIRKDIILRLKITRTWSTWLVAMEVVNLFHIIFEIWLVNRFLNGSFMGLGPQMFYYNDWNEIADPLETVFPKVTKCVFHKYGPSGEIQQHDALCVMALNVVHEKIYTVLWFWFLMLFIASLIAVIWRILSFFLYRRSLKFNQMMFRHVSDGKFNPYNVINVVNGCQYGDWLFLYYLAKNMHTLIFKQLFESLAEELEKQEVASSGDGDKAGGEPVLVSHIDFNDETLPLKDVKKAL